MTCADCRGRGARRHVGRGHVRVRCLLPKVAGDARCSQRRAGSGRVYTGLRLGRRAAGGGMEACRCVCVCVSKCEAYLRMHGCKCRASCCIVLDIAFCCAVLAYMLAGALWRSRGTRRISRDTDRYLASALRGTSHHNLCIIFTFVYSCDNISSHPFPSALFPSRCRGRCRLLAVPLAALVFPLPGVRTSRLSRRSRERTETQRRLLRVFVTWFPMLRAALTLR